MVNVTVNFEKELRAVKDMNCVNNGPLGSRSMNNYDTYKAARIPYARLHDAAFCDDYGGPHSVDIMAVFPDFDADENDPASYDFCLTDEYLDHIEAAGTKIFYRLGNSIEHYSKKYGAIPPKDYAKWARIAEHIVRHENEGWADGYHRGIEYWEIWNEPDLRGHECWTGTIGEYIDFFDVAVRHLKACFPNIKVGGPALTHVQQTEFFDLFLPYLKEKKPPMDFFSFHKYGRMPEALVTDTCICHNLMTSVGYGDAELILDEWNYLTGWSPKETLVYTYNTISSLKGASFVAACMIACQNSPLDMLMYYDARPSNFNGLFHRQTLDRLKGYYPFYAFADVRELGTQAETADDTKAGVYAIASVNKDRTAGALMFTRYRDEISLDGRDVLPEEVKITFSGLAKGKEIRVTYYLLDDEHDLTEVGGEVYSSDNGYKIISVPLYATYLIKYQVK